MKKQLITFFFVIFIFQNSEAVYITIENIGGRPITSASFNIDVEPFQSDYDFQLLSPRAGWGLSNIYFQFDEFIPIGVGETYITPLIPEITDVNFNLEGLGVSGWNIGTSTSAGFTPAIPDESTYTYYNSDIDFGYTISILSGGEPIPPPEPRILLIDNRTMGYSNSALNKILDDTQPQFSSGGDPVIYPADEPDLTVAAPILGDWLASIPFPLNDNWSDLQHISPQNPYTEKAIIYVVDAGARGMINLKGNFGVDNGIFIWVNGVFKFGATEPGADLAFEYSNIDLGNLLPGLNFIQILLEDHGGATGYKIQITGQLPLDIISVNVDIKPGSYPNCLNINGDGLITVAILGSDTFDVNQINIGTLKFAGLDVRVKGNSNPQCTIEDVSGDFTDPSGSPDGYDDLVCHFVDDVRVWAPHNGTATLTGELLDGTKIEGVDSICIVP